MKMNKEQHGLLLHMAITSNLFFMLSYLLSKSKLGINEPNQHGDTPLLVCLKLGRWINFIEELLTAGASINIANKRNLSPLSFATAFYDTPMTELLLKKTVDTRFMYDTLSENLRKALQSDCCALEIFVISREIDTEIILVGIMTPNSQYSDNLAVKELNIFLDQIGSYLQKSVSIYERLFLHSIDLKTAAAFKVLWSRIASVDITKIGLGLLYDYIEACEYNCSEYVECLRLILASQRAPQLIEQCISTTIYELLLYQFAVRRICKHHRMLVILDVLKLQKVTMEDVVCAYDYFEFNEEVVILLQHLQPSALRPGNSSHLIVEFLAILEKDPRLKVDKLGNLNFIARLNYGKLICSLPERTFRESEAIQSKKQVLNTVPTLYEMSRFASQKFVQKFYNAEDLNRFTQVVENLVLVPTVLKMDLCKNPPLYYSMKEECVT